MTTENTYTGDVPVTLGGQTYTLRYDWKALAAIRTKFEDINFAELMKDMDPESIAAVIAIGLQKHHPEMTAEAIIEISPPMVPLMEKISDAMTYALFGQKNPPEEVESEQGEDASPRPEPSRKK